MDCLMVLMNKITRDYLLETHLRLPIVKYLDLMKASNWDYLNVKCSELYL